MKKIIGIIAAVSMAASVFAVDFSGALKATGDLVNHTFKEDAQPDALSVAGYMGGGNGWGTRMQTSFSDEKAGASFVLTPGWSPTTNWANMSFWVKPIDQVKLSILGQEARLNTETITYGQGLSFAYTGSDYGWNLEIKPVDVVTINLFLDSTWIKAGIIQKTALMTKFNCGAAGTVGFMLKGSPVATKTWDMAALKTADLSGITTFEDLETAYKTKDTQAAFGTMDIAVGYSNTFANGKLGFFADVGTELNFIDQKGATNVTGKSSKRIDSMPAFGADMFFNLNLSPVTLKIFLNGITDLGDMSASDWYLSSAEPTGIKEYKNNRYDFFAANKLQAIVKAEIGLGAVTPYVLVRDDDIFKYAVDAIGHYSPVLAMTVKPGVTFSCGGASFDIGLELSFAQAKDENNVLKDDGSLWATLKVPFEWTYNF